MMMEPGGWNSDETVTAFEYVKSLVDEGYVPAIEKLGDGYDALITNLMRVRLLCAVWLSGIPHIFRTM